MARKQRNPQPSGIVPNLKTNLSKFQSGSNFDFEFFFRHGESDVNIPVTPKPSRSAWLIETDE